MQTDRVESHDRAVLLYRSRFTQIFSAVGFAAAGEAIEFRIIANLGYFVKQPVTFQHTEMAMVISAAAACGCGSHGDSPLVRTSDC